METIPWVRSKGVAGLRDRIDENVFHKRLEGALLGGFTAQARRVFRELCYGRRHRTTSMWFFSSEPKKL